MSSIQKVCRNGLWVACVCAVIVSVPASARAADTWAAIAYSTKTMNYGVGYQCDSEAKAKDLALANCKADDAKVMVTVKNGCCALAIGDKCYGLSDKNDGTYKNARDIAVAECRKFGKWSAETDTPSFVVLVDSTLEGHRFERAGDAASSIADEIIRLTNVERKKAGVPELVRNDKLTAGSAKYAALMAKKETLSHDLDGALGDRFTAYGYNWMAYAENCCAGQKDAAEAVKSWMDDKPHRDNLLSPNVTEIGVGVVKGADGKLYFCQGFGKPRK